jgi:hypothetical protein
VTVLYETRGKDFSPKPHSSGDQSKFPSHNIRFIAVFGVGQVVTRQVSSRAFSANFPKRPFLSSDVFVASESMGYTMKSFLAKTDGMGSF